MLNWTKTELGYESKTDRGVFSIERTPGKRFVLKANGENANQPHRKLSEVKEQAEQLYGARSAVSSCQVTLGTDAFPIPQRASVRESLSVQFTRLAFYQDIYRRPGRASAVSRSI